MPNGERSLTWPEAAVLIAVMLIVAAALVVPLALLIVTGK